MQKNDVSILFRRDEKQKLYQNKAWRLKRDYQLSTEPLCRLCREMGFLTVATVADHIEPHRGDQEKFWNGELQSLCARCHNTVKQSEERTGKKLGCDAAGIPLDPKSHWNR